MNQSYEQLFQLYVEKLSGYISPQDQNRLEKMLAEDAAFNQMWQSLEKQGQQLGIREFAERIDTEEELQELKKQLTPLYQHRTSKRVFLKKALAVAAIFLVMATGAYFAFFRSERIVSKEQIVAEVQKNKPAVSLVLGDGKTIRIDKSNDNTIVLGNTTLDAGRDALQYASDDTRQNTLQIPDGENYRIVLSDGTEVWLNAATSLRFPFRFSQAAREVYLEGEAFFKVAKNARHPFIVHTPLTDVLVTGTSFNINTYNTGNVRTALVEGKVINKSRDGKTVELEPGYEAGFETVKGFSTGPFESDEVLSWMEGVYYFHNMPVTELARLASRCYGVKIELDSKQFAGRSITGLLDRNKLTEFLNDLETVAHIQYYFSDDKLFLK